MARILVVDDDFDVVEMIRLALAAAKHDVASASNRKDGMKAVRDFKPDLLVLDVMMEQPDDGFVMAQDLRREGFKAPILMLTSIGKVTGLEFGKDDSVVPVDDFAEKPIDPATFMDKVAALIAKKGGR